MLEYAGGLINLLSSGAVTTIQIFSHLNFSLPLGMVIAFGRMSKKSGFGKF